MDIGSTILIIGFAALAPALILLVIGLVCSELMNSDIPRGASNSGKLHMVQGLFVGMAIVVSISMIGTVLIVFLSCFFFFTWIQILFLFLKLDPRSLLIQLFMLCCCPFFVLQQLIKPRWEKFQIRNHVYQSCSETQSCVFPFFDVVILNTVSQRE